MARSGIPGVEVQDNKREEALARLLGLKTTGKRSGFDAYDAKGNAYELKTTSKNDVGTGRDIGRSFVTKLRSEYFVAAKTDPNSSDWKPSEIIICHPDDLAEWIEEKLESRLAADETLLDLVISKLRKVLSEDQLARISYLMSRGMTYNNPKISWDYLKRNGTTLNLKNPKSDLEKFVNLRPLQSQK